jgi:hypothetical protein
MPMNSLARFLFEGGDDMPLFRARIRQHCAVALVGLLAVVGLHTSLSGANDVRQANDPELADGHGSGFETGTFLHAVAEGPRVETVALRDKKTQAAAEEAHPKNDHRVQTASEGTSSRAAKKAGIAALPLDKLTPEGRQKVQQILGSASIFRELPTLVFEVEPSVYQYFLMHPDVAVSIWRVMGVSNFKMFQTGPVAYEADVGDGTLGVIDVLYRTNSDSVVICNGSFKSPLLTKPIKANALMHLQSEFRQSRNGHKIVQHKLKLFVDFPSTTIETAAKIVTPVTNLIVDRNFYEVSMFLHMMSLAMARRPDWVQQLTAKLDGILEPSKMELANLTMQVHNGAVQAALQTVPGHAGIAGPGAPAGNPGPPQRIATTPGQGTTR